MTIVKKINIIYRYWESILVYIGCAMICLIFLGVTIDVLLRNIFRTGILGMTEYSSLWLLVVFLSALCLNTSESRQIVLDFVTEKAPAEVKEIMNLLGRLIAVFLFTCTMQYCFNQAVTAIIKGTSLTGVVPLKTWPYRTFLAVVWGSIIIRLLIDIIFSIDAIIHKKVYRFHLESTKQKNNALLKSKTFTDGGHDE